MHTYDRGNYINVHMHVYVYFIVCSLKRNQLDLYIRDQLHQFVTREQEIDSFKLLQEQENHKRQEDAGKPDCDNYCSCSGIGHFHLNK